MSARFMLMALMLVIGIVIGAFTMHSKAPPERNAGTIASVQSVTALPETLTPLQDEVAPQSPHPVENEKTTALLAKVAETTGDPDKVAFLAELLTAEVSKRRHLEKRLAELQNQVSRLETAISDGKGQVSSEQKTDDNGQTEAAKDPEKVSEDRFLAAGFDPVSAAELKKRASEIEMDRLYLRHQARREGWHRTPEYDQAVRKLRQSIKEELGEDAYDRFLFASERSNRLLVDSVMESSPAEQNGLQPGDIIFRYDGSRVFSYRDLRDATTRGEMGETVPVEIRRGGEVLEVDLPRGPLGVRLDRTTVQP
jgi:hypothetical protein